MPFFILRCDLLYNDRYSNLLAPPDSSLLDLLVLTCIKQDEFHSFVFQHMFGGYDKTVMVSPKNWVTHSQEEGEEKACILGIGGQILVVAMGKFHPILFL